MIGKSLELIYFPDKCCFHFWAQNIQTLIIKAVDISKVIHFYTMKLETTDCIPGDYLLCNVDTFYNLIQDAPDSIRYPGFSAEFTNGIKLAGDFNLTFIYAPDIDHLFSFSDFIFDAFGLSKADCKNAVLDNPNVIIRLTQKNGKLNYRIIPYYNFTDEGEDLDFIGSGNNTIIL